MPLIIPSGATVATGMSRVADMGLYADEIFIEGFSYSGDYDEPYVGQIQVERFDPDDSIEPKNPGSKLVVDTYENDVMNINCNNGFQKSVVVPQYYTATLPTPVLANTVWNTTEAIRIGRQKAALAALIAGLGSKQLVNPSDSSTALTTTNVTEMILEDLKLLRKNHARPDIVIMSVDAYSKMLSRVGKDFTTEYNDEVVRTGRIGRWMGMYFLESTLLSQGKTFKYIDGSGSTQSVNTTGVDYIMYDHRAFTIIDKLIALRALDSLDYVGTQVQMEIDSGFAVTNGDCVLVRQVSD